MFLLLILGLCIPVNSLVPRILLRVLALAFLLSTLVLCTPVSFLALRMSLSKFPLYHHFLLYALFLYLLMRLLYHHLLKILHTYILVYELYLILIVYYHLLLLTYYNVSITYFLKQMFHKELLHFVPMPQLIIHLILYFYFF